jgi:hypothetical protein
MSISYAVHIQKSSRVFIFLVEWHASPSHAVTRHINETEQSVQPVSCSIINSSRHLLACLEEEMSRTDLNHVNAAVALDLIGSSSFLQFPL